MTQIHDLPTIRLSLDDVHPHPRNPRRGNLPMIKASLMELGQYRPIVVNAGSQTGRPNEIIAGHHLALAAKELGWVSIGVTMIDVDDDTATRILLADNRTSDLASYDDRLLLEVLTSLPTLDGTGYEPGDVSALEALLRDHPWEDDDLDEVLDQSERDAWPEIRCKLPPDLYQRFILVDGSDDAERIINLLEVSVATAL